MAAIVFLQIIAIICIPLLAGMFAKHDRAAAMFVALLVTLQISALCWTVFVAVHFLGKYW